MSVGGIVIGVSVRGEDAHVSTAELACWKKRGPKLDLLNATGVWVKHYGHAIAPGDILWWQGGRAMLSPLRFREMPEDQKREGEHFDIILERVGYSHETFAPEVEGWLGALAEERCTARERKALEGE